MTENTVNMLGIFCAGKIAMKSAWKILNVFAMYWVGLGQVLCPFPCDVLAVYLLGPLPLAPSDLLCLEDDCQGRLPFLWLRTGATSNEWTSYPWSVGRRLRVV